MMPFVILGLLIILDVVALLYGVDSRLGVNDNRRWWPGSRVRTIR